MGHSGRLRATALHGALQTEIPSAVLGPIEDLPEMAGCYFEVRLANGIQVEIGSDHTEPDTRFRVIRSLDEGRRRFPYEVNIDANRAITEGVELKTVLALLHLYACEDQVTSDQ